MSAQIGRDLSPTSQAVQSVVIADKRAHYRETLGRVLKRSAVTVAEAATLSQAARLATGLKPDVVLLDVDLVLNVTSERLRRLAAKFPDLRIIIMLNEDLPQYRAAVRERWGYLCMAKERPEEELRALGILTHD
jgi:DNA-binding NarL/FixJ family response regulator